MSGTKTQWLRGLRIVTFCLVSGSIGLIPARFALGGQNFSGQVQEASLAETVTLDVGLSRVEVEEFLRTARVVQHKGISTGVTNSQRATLDNGNLKHDVHTQTVDISKTSFQTVRGNELNFRDCYKYNMAAYELDKLLELNMVPASVEHRPQSGQFADHQGLEDLDD